MTDTAPEDLSYEVNYNAAFGMGIDRPDIRLIVHTTMPSSIETYHQEIGRAGRDGLPSDCVIFWHANDHDTWCERFANDESIVDDGHKAELSAHMNLYCSSENCRHAQLVEYFGGAGLSGPCGACDRCE